MSKLPSSSVWWFRNLAIYFTKNGKYIGMDDTAKGGLTQFKERFTVIPCASKDLKR